MKFYSSVNLSVNDLKKDVVLVNVSKDISGLNLQGGESE